MDRSSDQVTAPSINTTRSKIRDSRDPCYVIKQKIWDMWAYIHSYLLLGKCPPLFTSTSVSKFIQVIVLWRHYFPGHTFIAVRDGDFLFTYCLWFEDTSGNPVQLQNPLPVLLGSPPPGIMSSSFYKWVVPRTDNIMLILC